MNKAILGILLSIPLTLSAWDWDWWIGGPHSLSVGPEIYYLKRTNAAGSHQEGVMYGAHFLYHRLRPQAIYWGVDGFVAKGMLHGETGRNASSGDRSELRSRKYDRMIEGRLGYTFQCPGDQGVLFALFGGWSLFEGSNKFLAPSPKELKFSDKVWSGVMGGLLHIPVGSNFTIELQGRVLRMARGECKVTDDPVRGDLTQSMGDETQALVDLPLAYHFEGGGLRFAVEAVPFYRGWLFGGRLNFPSRYFTTRFQHYGCQALVTCSF